MKAISTIYEDEQLLVLDKPSGLMVHGNGKTTPARRSLGAGGETTLADLVLLEYPELKEVGEPLRAGGKTVYRPGIVHRLDRETSGVIVVAKDQKTFSFLKKQFQGREVKKTYVAIVHGRMKGKRGTIDRPLGRSKRDFRQYSAHATARGELREAITEYTVKGHLKEGEREFTHVLVFPKTGRTHQIRAHFKFIHHPVVCDATYAGKQGCALGLSRLALHAEAIEFESPSGKHLSFQSDLPEDMKRAVTEHSV